LILFWYKRHPRVLERDSTELSNNSNYQELWQLKDKLFISSGNIIVRNNKKKDKYPILFIYQNSTPYTLPLVFLLEKPIPEDIGIKIAASNNIGESHEYFVDYIKFYYFRHQNKDGSLCLLNSDNLGDDDIVAFSASQIIERVRYWFLCLETNTFPVELPNVEFYAHSPNTSDQFKILYRDNFFDENIVKGEFYLSKIRDFPVRQGIVLAFLIEGIDSTGIRPIPKISESDYKLLPEGIEKIEDFFLKEQIIQQSIEQEMLIKGDWWDIDSEPQPIKEKSDLAFLLSPESISDGYKILCSKIGEKIQKLKTPIILGFRFFNRQNKKEWVFIELQRKLNTSKTVLFGKVTEKELEEQFDAYNLLAIENEEFTENQYHLRNKGRIERSITKSKKVSIIGCGALGGEVADILSKAGIGAINLIDNQEFKAHNAIRHVLGIEYFGAPKSYALKFHLNQHNPFTHVNPFVDDILKKDIEEYLPKDFFGISTIADDNIEGFLNEQAIYSDKIVFYSRSLRGGKAGRIFRVIPGIDACKNCLSLYKKENIIFPLVEEDTSLPAINNECNNPIRPASAADLKLLASLTSQLIIDFIQKPTNEINHWVWSTEKDVPQESNPNGTPQLFSYHLPPHTECDLCKMKDKLKVIISSSLAEVMKNEIKTNMTIETGGVLAGYSNDARQLVITHISGPGPNAVKKRDGFSKDVDFCQKFLDDLYKVTKSKSRYLGEWHYHPSLNKEPSRIDISSLSDISMQPEYLLEEPLMIIITNDFNLHFTVHPSFKEYYNAGCDYIDYID